MRLDTGGQRSTIAELMTRFGAEPWIFELEELLNDDAPVAVRRYAAIDTDEDLDTGDGPYAFVVDGDLIGRGHASFWTDDYRQGRLIVNGNLRVRSLSFGNGARVIVRGDAEIERACFGQYGDRNAVLDVAGTLVTPALLLDSYTAAYAGGGIRAVIYAGLGFYEEFAPDIANVREGLDGSYFRPDVLDRYRDLDFQEAIGAVRAGRPLFRPGVQESFPARETLRHT